MITKSIFLYLLIFHFIFICWFNLSLSSSLEGYKTGKSPLIFNTDSSGSSHHCFLTVFPGTGGMPGDASSKEVLHKWDDDSSIASAWQWQMGKVSQEVPKELGWKGPLWGAFPDTCLRGTCSKRQHVHTSLGQAVPEDVLLSESDRPFLLWEGSCSSCTAYCSLRILTSSYGFLDGFVC